MRKCHFTMKMEDCQSNECCFSKQFSDHPYKRFTHSQVYIHSVHTHTIQIKNRKKLHTHTNQIQSYIHAYSENQTVENH